MEAGGEGGKKAVALSETDAQLLIEVLQAHIRTNNDRIESLHESTEMVRGFPEWALALRGHCEMENAHCYRMMGMLQKSGLTKKLENKWIMPPMLLQIPAEIMPALSSVSSEQPQNWIGFAMALASPVIAAACAIAVHKFTKERKEEKKTANETILEAVTLLQSMEQMRQAMAALQALQPPVQQQPVPPAALPETPQPPSPALES